jgi:hypothetical protein
MQSPNTPVRREHLTQEELQAISGSALDHPALGMMGPLIVPLVTIGANPHLRWGEWLGIAITRIAAMVIAAEVVFLSLSVAWFGDTHHILLGGIPLALACLSAALIMRIFELFPSIRRAEAPVLGLGIVVTALALIRFAVFSHLSLGDWSWIGSFGQITDINAQLPHTELGVIAISVVAWVMGLRVARNAGSYDSQRAAFISWFVAIIAAILLVTLAVHTDGSRGTVLEGQTSAVIALALPGYLLLGLFMLSQVRLAELRGRLSVTGGGDRRSLTIWRLATAGMTAFSLLFVVIAGVLFYSGAYIQAFNWLLAIIEPIFLAILFVIFALISAVISLLGGGGSTTGASRSGTCVPLSKCIADQYKGISADTAHTSFIIFLVIIVVLAVVVTYFLLRRMLARHTDDEYEEIQESINPRDTVRERLSRSGGAGVPLDVPAAGTVRVVYRDLLGKSAAHGLVRQEDETAAGFERRVAPALAGATGADQTTGEPAVALDRLTHAYERERYGALAATPDRFAQARLLLLGVVGALPGVSRRSDRIERRQPHGQSDTNFGVSSRPAWDFGAVIAVLLELSELLYLHFLPAIVERSNHGLVPSLATFAGGLLALAMPIFGIVLGHRALAMPRMRLRALNRTIAVVALAIGYVVLLVAIFASFAIIFGALGNIFADL